MSTQVIPPHGGYGNLLSYRKTEIIYDATVKFCERFFHKYDRMIDQMVQAARSGKQNVVEGSMVSGTSKETEIKLTGCKGKPRRIAQRLSGLFANQKINSVG